MIIRANGLKAWLFILGVAVILIAILVVAFNVLLFLLPIILIIIIMSYLFRILNKVKKGGTQDFVEAKFRIKKK